MPAHRKRKRESVILGRLLERIAPRIGARVLLEPQWGLAGQITFASGRRSYFRYNTLDLNPVGSSEIAKDKDWSNFFLAGMGYPIVPGSKAFFSEKWAKAIRAPQRNIDAAYRHAQKLGFPVIVKPNSGSQGSGVALVGNKRDFYRALKSIFTKDRVALVQKQVLGSDYRLVVLDDAVVSAYERLPLSIVGDGKSTIHKLLREKQKSFKTSGRDTQLNFEDPRIASKLSRQHLTFQSRPKDGERVFLLDNANLSTGGDAVDVTDAVHEDFRQLAVNITRDMGLRLCGVDLLINGTIKEPPKEYYVLEINAAPGLDHYAKTGETQESIVEDLYLKVLRHLDREPRQTQEGSSLD